LSVGLRQYGHGRTDCHKDERSGDQHARDDTRYASDELRSYEYGLMLQTTPVLSGS
jgi:hypothetical protein